MHQPMQSRKEGVIRRPESVHDDTRRVFPQELREASVAILDAAGVPPENSRIVADHLVTADLRGHASHGISRLPTYVQRLRGGLIRGDAEVTVIRETPTTLVYDAGSNFGHVAGKHAMDGAISRARSSGLAAAAVRNSTHFGSAGIFAHQATDAGMIGIVCSNAASRMPPVGGITPVLGSNPIAIAAPRASSPPIMLDMATSSAALGKIIAARDAGAPIPVDWALAADGSPTVDPQAAIDGVLLPMAGPKGFGLALSIEILSAVLTGSAVAGGAGSMYKTWDRPEDLGHFFIALSIEAFMPLSEFFERLEELAVQVKGAKRLRGMSSIYLPGEMEFQREVEGRKNGLDLATTSLRSLDGLAAEYELRTVKLCPTAAPGESK